MQLARCVECQNLEFGAGTSSSESHRALLRTFVDRAYSAYRPAAQLLASTDDINQGDPLQVVAPHRGFSSAPSFDHSQINSLLLPWYQVNSLHLFPVSHNSGEALSPAFVIQFPLFRILHVQSFSLSGASASPSENDFSLACRAHQPKIY